MSEAPEAGAPVDDVVVAAADAGEAPAQTSDAASEIEEAAGKGGWLPKDQWTGDPDKWVDAPKFVLKAAEILPQLTADLKEARAEIKTVKKAVADSAKFISAAEKRAYDQGVKEATARLDAAAAIGDVDGVREATKDIVDLSKTAIEPSEPEIPAEFAAWQTANPWFNKDKPLTAAMLAIADEVYAEGYRGPAQIKEADKRVREAFPSKFTNPNRERAAPVEGGGNGPRKAGKTFSDMSPEAREMCVFFEKNTKGFSRDNYVKQHFAETTK